MSHRKPTQREMARYGTPVRCTVEIPVAHALLDEAKRCRGSVSNVASAVLTYWYEDIYLPNQKLREKQK